jgi:hypothetical protein
MDKYSVINICTHVFRLSCLKYTAQHAWHLQRLKWGDHTDWTGSLHSLLSPSAWLTLSVYPPGINDHKQFWCSFRAGKVQNWQKLCGWLPVAQGTLGWGQFSWWEGEICVSGLVNAGVQMVFTVFLGRQTERTWNAKMQLQGSPSQSFKAHHAHEQQKGKALSKAGVHTSAAAVRPQ